MTVNLYKLEFHGRNSGGAAAHVAVVPAVGGGAAVHTEEEIFIMQLHDMKMFHDSVSLDETRRKDLQESVSSGVYELWIIFIYTKNFAVLRELLQTTIPLLQSDMEQWQKNILLFPFMTPLRNLLTRYCSFEFEVKHCSALLLARLQNSTEFDRSFEGPEQKQEMVKLMQDFCKIILN